MKQFKKFVVILLVIAMCASVVAISASAGTVAYGTASVTADVLNIRSGPSTSYSIVSTVDYGSTVVVLEQTSDSWYHINYNGTDGYVSADYLANLSTTASFSGTGTVTGYAVRIRSDAGTDAGILGSLDSGTTVTVLGIKNGWYNIQYGDTTGYMRSDYISLSGVSSSSSGSSGSSDSAKAGTVTGDYVNVRSGAGTSYSVIGMLSSGASVTVLGTEGSWYKIQYGSTTGYMFSAYVSVSSSSSSDSSDSSSTAGTVTGDYVNVRSGPDTSYSVIDMLSSGTAVTVLGTEGSWYKIQYGSTTGYMFSAYVSVGGSSSGGGSSSDSDSALGQQIADYALQFEGYDYVYGGASPSEGFDCSGFVMYVYEQFGYSMPHGATSQYNCSLGYTVSKSDLQPGDLVFFSDDGFASITHVGLYIGNGQFIHASNSRVGVIISDINSSYYTSVYYSAKRIV